VSRLLPVVPSPLGGGAAGPGPAAAPAAHHPDTLGERGTLEISERAARRVAAVLLTEVGDLAGPDGKDLPAVRARVDAGSAELDVRCAVAYPAPAARVLDEARGHVIRRMGELTGLAVRRVDLSADALVPRAGGGRVR
jgi:hypothetical protein